jgi:hypothetical protein
MPCAMPRQASPTCRRSTTPTLKPLRRSTRNTGSPAWRTPSGPSGHGASAVARSSRFTATRQGTRARESFPPGRSPSTSSTPTRKSCFRTSTRNRQRRSSEAGSPRWRSRRPHRCR